MTTEPTQKPETQQIMDENGTIVQLSTLLPGTEFRKDHTRYIVSNHTSTGRILVFGLTGPFGRIWMWPDTLVRPIEPEDPPETMWLCVLALGMADPTRSSSSTPIISYVEDTLGLDPLTSDFIEAEDSELGVDVEEFQFLMPKEMGDSESRRKMVEAMIWEFASRHNIDLQNVAIWEEENS